MCLLFMKPRGVKYDHDFTVSAINSGIQSNRDGIGGAYRNTTTNKLYLKKGFYPRSKDDFFAWLEKINPHVDDELMVHLRYGTAGNKSTYNQHPYILGEKAWVPQQAAEPNLTLEDELTSGGVFAHNGGFYDSEYRLDNPNLSDTYNWGLTYFKTKKDIQDLIDGGYESLVANNTLASTLIGQKVCFMFPNRDMIHTENFKSDRGYLFSNYGYKSYVDDRGGKQIINSQLDEIDDFQESLFGYDSHDWEGGIGVHSCLYPVRNRNVNLEKLFPAAPVMTKNNEEVFEDANIVEETEVIISKTEARNITKVINSSFNFELELTKPIIPITRYKSNRELKRERKNKTRLSDPWGFNRKTNFSSKSFDVKSLVDDNLKTSNDFNLDIKIDSDNCKEFILVLNKDLERKGYLYSKGDRFQIRSYYPTTNKFIVRQFTEAGDLEDWNMVLEYQELVNYRITPRACYIDKYKDYVRLQTLYNDYISKNKYKVLVALVDSVLLRLTIPNNTQKTFTFCKSKYDGTALVAFYKNLVPNHGEGVGNITKQLVTPGPADDDTDDDYAISHD